MGKISQFWRRRFQLGALSLENLPGTFLGATHVQKIYERTLRLSFCLINSSPTAVVVNTTITPTRTDTIDYRLGLGRRVESASLGLDTKAATVYTHTRSDPCSATVLRWRASWKDKGRGSRPCLAERLQHDRSLARAQDWVRPRRTVDRPAMDLTPPRGMISSCPWPTPSPSEWRRRMRLRSPLLLGGTTRTRRGG